MRVIEGPGKYIKSLGALLACGLLVACNSGSGNVTDNTLSSVTEQNTTANAVPDRTGDLRAFCPRTVIRDGTEVYRTFTDGVTRKDPNAMNSLEFQSTIIKVARECNYTPLSLGMKIGVRGRVINGPTGATGTLNVPIRVAITKPATKEVVYSQLHQVPVTLAPGQNNASFSFVDSQINIPVPKDNDIIVYVGFDEGPPETAQKETLQRVN